MRTYLIILISTLISTQNVPICKFKYQSMFDYYADHQMGTAVKVLRSLMHNTVVYIYLHSYKINILICNSKTCWMSKETLMHNSDTIM